MILLLQAQQRTLIASLTITLLSSAAVLWPVASPAPLVFGPNDAAAMTTSHNWSGYTATDGAFTSVMGMWTIPSVSVPVLSAQSTFMLPKFSIEARRFTITFRDAIRFAPWARLMAMIAGSSWGVSQTARATANRNDSNTGR